MMNLWDIVFPSAVVVMILAIIKVIYDGIVLRRNNKRDASGRKEE